VCKQLAQGRYMEVERAGSNPLPADRKSNALIIPVLRHDDVRIFKKIADISDY